MYKGTCPPELYAAMMDALKRENADYKKLYGSREYRTGSMLLRGVHAVKKADVKALARFKSIAAPGKGYTVHNVTRGEDCPAETPVLPEEYFSDEKIAVYTCVFGTYDHIQEPVCRPDNVEYFIITDQPLPADTVWKPLDWEQYCDPSWSNAEKNRYCKMHPHVLFPDFRYSVYVDGNIKVIADLTPYIYRTGTPGMAFHAHSKRVCAYDELDAVAAVGRISRAKAEAYRQYLEKNGLPREYGMAEGNVIVRDHENECCRKIMGLWWKQFRERISRDQVSLPLILYRLGIPMSEVTTLGYDVRGNNSLRVMDHVHQNEK